MRYANLATLEDGYGINLLPLATFARDTYADDPCTIFAPKMNFADAEYNEKTLRLITQMHKAITVCLLYTSLVVSLSVYVHYTLKIAQR